MAEQPSPLATTFATWVYQLHASGTTAEHGDVRAACEAVALAADATAGETAGMALVGAVGKLISDDGPAGIAAAAAFLYGDRVNGGLGEGSRSDRTARIRRYQFAVGLPWLARIWERRSGEVVPNWVIVERLTDEVTAMDPNPWDDVDEERHLPVADFQVLWELDGCTALAVGPS